MDVDKENKLIDEDQNYLEEIQQCIDESAKEISRINEALGLGLVTVRENGIYREFNNGESILIKAGDFRRKKVGNRRIKIH